MDGFWKAYFELNGKTLEETTTFLLRISEGTTRAVWFYHPSSKKGKAPHIHGLFENWNGGIDDTFRNKIKAFFLVKGKQLGVSNNFDKGKAMTKDNYHKYITYMSKGVYDPLVVYKWDKDEIDARKQMWVGENANDNANEVEIVKVKSRISQYGIAQLAKAQYMEEYTESYIRDNGYESHKLVKIVIKVLKDNQRLAHKIQVRNIVQDIEAEIDPVRYVNDIVKML